MVGDAQEGRASQKPTKFAKLTAKVHPQILKLPGSCAWSRKTQDPSAAIERADPQPIINPISISASPAPL